MAAKNTQQKIKKRVFEKRWTERISRPHAREQGNGGNKAREANQNKLQENQTGGQEKVEWPDTQKGQR